MNIEQKKICDQLFDDAKQLTIDDQKHDTIFIIKNDKKSVVIIGNMENERSKDITALLVRFIANHIDADEIIMISEVWMAHGDKHMDTSILPSQREDRQEALFLSSENKNGDVYHRSAEIVRNDSGAIENFNEAVSVDGGGYSGRFTHLFEPISDRFLKEFLEEAADMLMDISEHYSNVYHGDKINFH